MRRSAVRVAAVLLSALLAPAFAPVAASAAAGVHDALVVDVLSEDSLDTFTSSTTYDSDLGQAPVAGPSSVPGGVRVARPADAASGPGIEVLPADDAPLEVGRYAFVSGSWTAGVRPVPVVRMTTAVTGCFGFVEAGATPDTTAGWLDITAISYDGSGTVTSLAATFSMQCSLTPGIATGTIRFNSDAPYASVPSSLTTMVNVASGSHTPVDVTLENRGSSAIVLGEPLAVDHPADAPALVVTGEGETCSAEPLQPGASCVVHAEYVDDDQPGGSRLAELRLAAPALPRGFVAILAKANSVTERPAAPKQFAAEAAYDGIRLLWMRDSATLPDGFRIRRTDGAEPVLVADVAGGSSEWWVDTSLAKGESATYTVSAYNAAGEGPETEPVTVTRPDLPDPVASDRRVLVVAGPAGQSLADTALGAVFTSQLGYRGQSWELSTPQISLTFPRIHGPGTYVVGERSGSFNVTATAPGLYCAATGLAVVRQAWMRADMTPYLVDADFHLSCNDKAVEVQLRVGTDSPYSALTTSGPGDFAATVGQAPSVRVLTLTNPGAAAVNVGAPQLSGPDASSFSITGSTCPGSLTTGQSCTVDVAFTPARSLRHVAVLSFAVSDPLGVRTIPLVGNALGPPPSPGLSVHAAIGRAYASWSAPTENGGSPITGYRVMRSGATGDFVELAHLDATWHDWSDTGLLPGSTYRYRVLAENQYGLTPASQATTVVVVVPHEVLIASVPDPHAAGSAADLVAAPVGNTDPLPFLSGQDTDSPTVSPDGKWIAYTVTDTDGDKGLWLRTADNDAASVLVDSADTDELDPAWSPDSKTVAYTALTGQGVSVGRIAIAAGAVSAPYPGSAGARQPTWLADGSGIVVAEPTGLARITLAGIRTSITGPTAGAWRPAVSPRGDQIAYVTTAAAATDRLWLVPVGGGTPLSVAQEATDDLGRPVWSPDAKDILVNLVTADGAPSDELLLWHAAVGTQPAGSERVPGPGPTRGVGWQREDRTAPVTTFPGAQPRTGPAVTIPVRVVDDTVPVGGLVVMCLLDGKAVGRCASGWSGTLAAGTHVLTVTATDPHGRTSTSSYRWVVDTTAPSVLTKALPPFTTTGTAVFGYGASDAAGVASYDVRYRRAVWSDTGFRSYAIPTGWGGTTALSRSLAVVPGTEYCFSVRARDKVGNVSGWSSERCTAAPLDDRSLSRATGGWSSISSTGAFRGTLTSTRTVGAMLKRTGVRVRRLELVATTCATCGYVDVYVNTTKIGRVSLVSSTTTARRELSLTVLSGITSGTITLRTSSSSKLVRIDGLGLRRT